MRLTFSDVEQEKGNRHLRVILASVCQSAAAGFKILSRQIVSSLWGRAHLGYIKYLLLYLHLK